MAIPNASRSVIADTGFWVTLGVASDVFHHTCRRIASETGYDPVTTWPVITETCYLLSRKDRRDFHTYHWKGHEPFENLIPEMPD